MQYKITQSTDPKKTAPYQGETLFKVVLPSKAKEKFWFSVSSPAGRENENLVKVYLSGFGPGKSEMDKLSADFSKQITAQFPQLRGEQVQIDLYIENFEGLCSLDLNLLFGSSVAQRVREVSVSHCPVLIAISGLQESVKLEKPFASFPFEAFVQRHCLQNEKTLEIERLRGQVAQHTTQYEALLNKPRQNQGTQTERAASEVTLTEPSSVLRSTEPNEKRVPPNTNQSTSKKVASKPGAKVAPKPGAKLARANTQSTPPNQVLFSQGRGLSRTPSKLDDQPAHKVLIAAKQLIRKRSFSKNAQNADGQGGAPSSYTRTGTAYQRSLTELLPVASTEPKERPVVPLLPLPLGRAGEPQRQKPESSLKGPNR